MSPNGNSVYVTSDTPTGAVLQYTVGPNGALMPASPPAVPAGAFPLGIAIDPDGKTVYAANSGDNTISQYTVGSGGRLTAGSPATVATGLNPIVIAVSPVARIPTSREQCKNGGWRRYGFKSPGTCLAFVIHQATKACVSERDAIGGRAFRQKYGAGRFDLFAMLRCIARGVDG